MLLPQSLVHSLLLGMEPTRTGQCTRNSFLSMFSCLSKDSTHTLGDTVEASLRSSQRERTRCLHCRCWPRTRGLLALCCSCACLTCGQFSKRKSRQTRGRPFAVGKKRYQVSVPRTKARRSSVQPVNYAQRPVIFASHNVCKVSDSI